MLQAISNAIRSRLSQAQNNLRQFGFLPDRQPSTAPQQLPLGERGESLACDHLKRKGWRIIQRGHRSKMGELDIVALDGDTIVFVEVKTRRDTDVSASLLSVNQKKQQKLTNLALAYLKRRSLLDQRSRFDVIGISWPDDHAQPTIRHIENAFEAVGRGQMFS